MSDVGRGCVRAIPPLVLWLSMACGCQSRELAPIDPCLVSSEVRELEPISATKVDVLLVVDNSGSMREEQESLAREIPRLVNALATGDLDADGVGDFPPVPDLHIGVVSTDMGTGPVDVASCSAGVGEDGILRTRATAAGCAETYPSFLELESPVLGEPDPAMVDDFVTDSACLARLGTDGCGFEQQLEAPLKALTPATSSTVTFAHGTGHGDGANAGFLRDDSLLAVILITDEEDCSASDPRIYDAAAGFSGGLNVRCYRDANHHALHPASRYVDGLLALRDPRLFVFAAIVGVPPDLVSTPGTPTDYDGILAHPDMQYRDTGDDGFPIESCVAPDGRGEAYPPRRIVEFARDLEARGGNAVVQSICQRSFAGAVTRILERIGGQLDGLCLGRPLHPDAEGMVGCRVIETITESSEIRACDELPGRVDAIDPSTGGARRSRSGEPMCRVVQLPVPRPEDPAPTAPGWFYEEDSPRCPQRVRFTRGAAPVPGVRVHLECLQPLVSRGDGDLALGSPCEPGTTEDDCAASGAMGGALRCDDVTRTCQLPCHSDADCTGRGLGGFVCDTEDVSPFGGSMCVNPTCGGRLLDG